MYTYICLLYATLVQVHGMRGIYCEYFVGSFIHIAYKNMFCDSRINAAQLIYR